MTTFLLVHGAYHGAWCWERVAPLLEDAGCTAIAPDLPGMGADKTPFSQTSFDHWARFVADIARAAGEPVVLVGHSRGGMVISQAAEHAPEAISLLVYLTAFVAENGKCLFDVAGWPRRASPPEVIPADLAAAPARFYGATPPEWTERALSRLGPEPAFGLYGAAAISAERFGRVAKAYVECRDDQAIPLALQRRMQAQAGITRVESLPGDHSPFYARPQELAAALLRLAGA